MNYRKDIFFNMVGNFANLGALWLMTVVIVRLSDFRNAGLLSLAITTSNIFIPIASYNLRYYLASDLKYRFSDRQYFVTRFFTTIVSMFCCVIISLQNGYTREQITVILLFYVYKAIEYCSDIIYGIEQRKGKLYIGGISLAVKSVITLLIFTIVLWMGFELQWALIGIQIVSLFFLVAVDRRMVRKMVSEEERSNDRSSFSSIIGLLKACALLAVIPFCNNFVTSIPRLAFEKMYTTEEFGIYSSLSTITVLISTVVSCVMLPFVSKFTLFFEKREIAKLKKITINSILLTVGIGAVVYIGLSFWGIKLLQIIFGKDMTDYSGVLNMIILATILASIVSCFNTFFTATRKYISLVISSLMGVLCTIMLAEFMCKKYYMNGIAYSLIVAQAAECIFMLIVVLNFFRKNRENSNI